MTAAIEASGLGKAYRRTWALRDCTLAIPEGHVVGPALYLALALVLADSCFRQLNRRRS
jgi:hypothetical protein